MLGWWWCRFCWGLWQTQPRPGKAHPHVQEDVRAVGSGKQRGAGLGFSRNRWCMPTADEGPPTSPSSFSRILIVFFSCGCEFCRSYLHPLPLRASHVGRSSCKRSNASWLQRCPPCPPQPPPPPPPPFPRNKKSIFRCGPASPLHPHHHGRAPRPHPHHHMTHAHKTLPPPCPAPCAHGRAAVFVALLLSTAAALFSVSVCGLGVAMRSRLYLPPPRPPHRHGNLPTPRPEARMVVPVPRGLAVAVLVPTLFPQHRR